MSVSHGVEMYDIYGDDMSMGEIYWSAISRMKDVPEGCHAGEVDMKSRADRRYWWTAGVIGIVCVTLLVLVNLLRDDAAGPAAEDVLVRDLGLGDEWDRRTLSPRDEDGSVSDEAVMAWFRIPRDDLLQQVLHYEDVETAKHSFRSSPPEKVSPDIFSEAAEHQIGAELSSADEARFMCGQWTDNICRTWWSWARYDQYIVRVRYRRSASEPGVLTNSQLANIVEKIEAGVIKRIR